MTNTNAPTASRPTMDPAVPGAEGAPAAGRYVIDPARTTVGLTGKHFWGTGSVHATFQLLAGTIWVGDSPEASRADVCVAASSFNSKNARRDKAVLSDKFLGATTHPEIRFTSQRIVATGDGSWVATGTLAVRGVNGSTDVHVDGLAVNGNELTLHATAEVDRYAYDMTKSKGMVGRMYQLELTVVASRDETTAP